MDEGTWGGPVAAGLVAAGSANESRCFMARATTMVQRALPILCLLLAASAWAAEPAATPKPDPEERIAGALLMQLESLDAQEHALSEWLQLFGKITNENFILDPGLPRTVGETKLTVRVRKGGTVLDALAVALALAGLRYAILDGAVFISTEGRLADKVLAGQRIAEPLGSARTRQPMSTGEAIGRTQIFDPYQDGFIGAADMLASSPWRLWEGPRYNPRTGLTDYPGPPVWIEDPDIGHPRFRYTATPFFLKPEYLAWEQEKREMREDQERRERAERQANARALAALLQLLKENPEMKVRDVLEKLGEK